MKKNAKGAQKSAPSKPSGRKKKKEKTEIIIYKERCKGCTYCVEFCPKDVLEMSEEFNKKGAHIPKVARPEACISCEVCQYVCPDLAIFVHRIPQPEEDEENS
jgi:2-oxoglutarate ferredoxin oxidoreductase subunit delta